MTLTAHGDERVDDWYWLRNRDDPEVIELLEAENAHTKAATAGLEPLVDAVYGEILARVRLTDVSLPAPKGPWAYYVRTVDGLEHLVHCRRPVGSPAPPVEPGSSGTPTLPADEHEVVLLDENALAEGHDYLELGGFELSSDQNLLAYAVDTTGGERFTIRFRDLSTGEELSDVIENAYYGLAFSADASVLWYTRPDEAMRPHQIYQHVLGQPHASDRCVWEEPDQQFFLGVGTTKDERYVVFHSQSNVTSEVRLLDATEPDGALVVVQPRRQDVEYSVEHHHGELLVLTNDGAENFALFRAPVATPGREHWEPLVAHRPDVRLEALDVVEGFALVHERGHASTAVRLVDLAGGAERVICPPEEAGSVFLGENLDFDATSIRYQSTSLVTPLTVHEHDLATGSATVVWRRTVPGYEPSGYRTERLWATSDDGTEVPVTIAYRADRPGSPGPCLLYGYGAYEASTDPVFSTARSILPLLDRGGCYAIAHVRGGGELARRWYLDGKLGQKHHSFEDFVAAARLLVARGTTSPDQLAALGASAGGLLVGAVANLAPELFAGIVAAVPFVDVLTTMLDRDLPLTATEWEEWGNPVEHEDAYRSIKRYSPYDNVAPVRYPRMLVTGGLNDPRVSYFEPAKWVQKLRAAHLDNVDRVLLKTEMTAGHGGPSGRYRAWREWAFELAFVLEATGASKSS